MKLSDIKGKEYPNIYLVEMHCDESTGFKKITIETETFKTPGEMQYYTSDFHTWYDTIEIIGGKLPTIQEILNVAEVTFSGIGYSGSGLGKINKGLVKGLVEMKKELKKLPHLSLAFVANPDTLGQSVTVLCAENWHPMKFRKWLKSATSKVGGL